MDYVASKWENDQELNNDISTSAINDFNDNFPISSMYRWLHDRTAMI